MGKPKSYKWGYGDRRPFFIDYMVCTLLRVSSAGSTRDTNNLYENNSMMPLRCLSHLFWYQNDFFIFLMHQGLCYFSELTRLHETRRMAVPWNCETQSILCNMNINAPLSSLSSDNYWRETLLASEIKTNQKIKE